MAAAALSARLAALEALVPQLQERIEALERGGGDGGGEAEAPTRKRKADSAWHRAVRAAKLPNLSPAEPPRDKAKAHALREARAVLVQQFWGGVVGAGGREICAECAGRKPKPSWGHCRGRGKAAGNHGPDKEDVGPAAFLVGCRVRWGSHTGTVTAFDRASGFFTITREGAGDSVEIFLSHKSYAAAVLPALPQAQTVTVLPEGAGNAKAKPPAKPRAKKGGAGAAAKGAGANGGKSSKKR
jgi:hypothetical protein